MYEPVLAARLGAYNRGFKDYGKVKPDYIASDYKACAVTSAQSEDPDDISEAIRRTCHTVEFTSFLGQGMEGIEDYLMNKVERYALLLESV